MVLPSGSSTVMAGFASCLLWMGSELMMKCPVAPVSTIAGLEQVIIGGEEAVVERDGVTNSVTELFKLCSAVPPS
jgi:hypothetical protein